MGVSRKNKQTHKVMYAICLNLVRCGFFVSRTTATAARRFRRSVQIAQFAKVAATRLAGGSGVMHNHIVLAGKRKNKN